MKTLTCTSGDLAEALGLSEAQVFNLARSGVVVKIGRGQYDLVKSMRAYYEQKLDESLGNPESLVEQRTRLTRYQADLAKLQLDQQRGDVLPLDLCKQFFQSIMSSVRSQLMAISGTIGTDLPHIDTEDIIKIDTLIRSALTDASKAPMPPELRKKLEMHAETFTE